MSWRDLEDLPSSLDGIKVISTDVFDTLLLRNGRSERSRIMEAEFRFARLLAARGSTVSANILVQSRLCAQKLAFRALNVGGAGEVRIVDIITRQLRMLGLPEALAGDRLEIELGVEKACLRANEALGSILRRLQSAGVRVVAISDTTLPADKVRELLKGCHGADMVHRIYSSADEGKTKRQGALFSFVAASEGVSPEQMLHIGDDEVADHRVPFAMGISTRHVPRGRMRRYLSLVDGGSTEIRRQIRRRANAVGSARPSPRDALSFGRDVFGPIVSQFCLLIWLYADQARATDKTALLFCARGGIGIRDAFERVLERLGLPLATFRDNIMVSRLVAARAAVMMQSEAAVEELGREFGGSSFADVAQALGGRAYNLPVEWRRPFDAKVLFALLSTESGGEVQTDIQRQNALFTRHLHRIVSDAKRIILCDTGLYGSTQRLLAAGFPDLAFETVQLARANYKGHSEEHFPRVVGLLVEQNLYHPLKVETCILRYWQLIESLFEPAIPSVRSFSENEGGEIVANCGIIAHGALDPSVGNPLLTGVLQYIDTLPRDGGGVIALRDAEIAWRRLKQAITRPTEDDVSCLEIGVRSVDFGRSGVVGVLGADQDAGFMARLKSIKAQLWREGAIVRGFPLLKSSLLSTLETAYTLRAFSAHLYR
jgi:FMN phosphatase YigB (HAD superfamily)